MYIYIYIDVYIYIYIYQCIGIDIDAVLMLYQMIGGAPFNCHLLELCPHSSIAHK